MVPEDRVVEPTEMLRRLRDIELEEAIFFLRLKARFTQFWKDRHAFLSVWEESSTRGVMACVGASTWWKNEEVIALNSCSSSVTFPPNSYRLQRTEFQTAIALRLILIALYAPYLACNTPGPNFRFPSSFLLSILRPARRTSWVRFLHHRCIPLVYLSLWIRTMFETSLTLPS